MENSTKALAIAASVLIVLVLIAVGIRILAPSKGLANTTEAIASTKEVEVYNSQFQAFFGNAIDSSQAKALLSAIISNNNKESNHVILVVLEYANGSLDIYSVQTKTDSKMIEKLVKIREHISSDKTYKINVGSCTDYLTGYDSNGYISCIRLTENN